MREIQRSVLRFSQKILIFKDVSITGPKTSLGNTSYIGDGIFSAYYSLSESGTYTLSVKVNGQSILGSPFTLQLDPGNASPKND